MEWQKLDLEKASLLKKEVDTVISRLAEIVTNPVEIDKTSLVSTIQSRIQELDIFYHKNSEDERSILFEKEKLRLRKALQPFYGGSSRDNRSLAASEAVDRSAYDPTISNAQSSLSVSQLSKGGRAFSSSNKPPTTKSSAATISAKQSPISPGRIYAWEDSSEKPSRNSIEVNGVSFDPTPVTGFYTRAMGRKEAEYMISDKFIDVQIILTQEELTTLAARKKINRPDAKLFRSQAAATSVHSSTPYVDPRRIKHDMLRPSHPDRWLGSDAFTH
jgi:hypothetical protein